MSTSDLPKIESQIIHDDETRFRAYLELRKDYLAAVKLIGEAKAASALASTNISKGDLGQIISGVYQTFIPSNNTLKYSVQKDPARLDSILKSYSKLPPVRLLVTGNEDPMNVKVPMSQ